MSTSYDSAKRVALGLEDAPPVFAGDDLWNVSLDGGFGIAAEMPFQFFERGFEPPEEQVAQRTALMLFDTEYEADRKAAEERLAALEQALTSPDPAGVRRLAADAPLAHWLSLIFLDGTRLREELVPKLEQADPVCRAAFSEAAGQALQELVAFRDLLETLQKHC